MTTLGVFRDDFYPNFTALPSYQFTSITGTVMPVASVAGAAECYVTSSNAGPVVMPTGTQIITQVLNALLLGGINQPVASGTTYFVRVINTNVGTLTLTASAGQTFVGLNTLATNTFRCTVTAIMNFSVSCNRKT